MKRIAMVILLASVMGCGVGTPGNGEKVGQIVRVNKHGILCKTMEAQIMRGGFNGGSGSVGAAFDFTVENDADFKTLEDAMRSQREVIIQYRSEGFYSSCRTESGGDFLTKVELAPRDSTRR